jgi:enoyl-CoA hydratase/carnithine racemase
VTTAAYASSARSGDSLVLREDRGAVACLTLNRADARNALSEAMLQEIARAFDALSRAPQINAVVLTGAGAAFCAGHDLKELTAHRGAPDGGRAAFTRIFETCSEAMLSIVHCSKPVIAAVNGVATAAGCQLVASCDLAVAAENAEFGTPGVNIGLFCSTPMVALSRNVARKHAMEMLLLGDRIDATDAARFGLVNRVVEEGRALPEALSMAERIASKPRATVAVGKEAFYRQAEMDLQSAYDYASQAMAENMMSQDAEEGIGAFIDKRRAVWRRPS